MGILLTLFIWYLSILLIAALFGKGTAFWNGTISLITGIIPGIVNAIKWCLMLVWKIISGFFYGIWRLFGGY